MQIPQYLKVAWKRKDALVIFFLLCCFIAYLSWQFGLSQLANEQAPSTAEQYKLIYPFVASLLTLIVPFLVNNYIDEQVKKDVKEEVKKIKYELIEKESSDGIMAKQQLEFVAYCLANDKLRSPKSLLNENVLLPVVQEKIRQEPVSYFYDLSKSERERNEAVKALLKNEGTKEEVAWKLARSAIKEEFKLSDDERKSIGENFNAKENTICKEIYIYLKAWLVCSLKNGRYMPVEAIKLTYPKDKHRYRSALRLIYTDIIHREGAKADFPNYSIKKIIEDYLKYLKSCL